jgi:hypothetical protein
MDLGRQLRLLNFQAAINAAAMEKVKLALDAGQAGAKAAE